MRLLDHSSSIIMRSRITMTSTWTTLYETTSYVTVLSPNSSVVRIAV